ncbi:hypothetical protein KI387_007686, partial [Taxus chinensis]
MMLPRIDPPASYDLVLMSHSTGDAGSIQTASTVLRPSELTVRGRLGRGRTVYRGPSEKSDYGFQHCNISTLGKLLRIESPLRGGEQLGLPSSSNLGILAPNPP